MDYEGKLIAEDIWANFSFAGDRLWCRCKECAQNLSDKERIEQIPDGLIYLISNHIQPMRTELGFSFAIASGYRCPSHPNEFKKNSPGPHQYGAIDIGVTHKHASDLLRCSYTPGHAEGITGRGINQRGDIDKRFLHFDSLPAESYRPRRHIWSY